MSEQKNNQQALGAEQDLSQQRIVRREKQAAGEDPFQETRFD